MIVSLQLARQFIRHLRRKRNIPSIEWRVLSRHRALCRASNARISTLANTHRDQTIYCVGNGPSVKTQDLSLLNGKIALLTNRAHQLLERFTPRVGYNVVTDTEAFNKLGSIFRERPETTFVASHRLVNPYLTPELCVDRHLYLLPAFMWSSTQKSIYPEAIAAPGFSHDIRRCLYLGESVIFGAIQIARYLGARRIVLVGVDMNYTGDVKKDYGVARTDKPAMVMDYETHAKPMFEHCVRELSAVGVEFVNATDGGRVDCVRRMSLAEACRDA